MKDPDIKSAESKPVDFDQMLDSALQSYTPLASRPGLEGRILAAIAIENRNPLPNPYRWRSIRLFAVAATLALAAGLSLAWHFHKEADNVAQLQPLQSRPVVEPSSVSAPDGTLGDGGTDQEPDRIIRRIEIHPDLARKRVKPVRVSPASADSQASKGKTSPFGPSRATQEELLIARAAIENPDLLASLNAPLRDARSEPISIAPIPSRSIESQPIVMAAIEATPNPSQPTNHDR